MAWARDKVDAVKKTDSWGEIPPLSDILRIFQRRTRVRIMTFILVALVACTVSAGLWDAAQAEKKAPSPQSDTTAIKTKAEAEVPAKSPAVEAQPEKKAVLSLGKASKNKVVIDLVNSVPVRGVQFTLSGVKMTEVRAVSRTTGFFVKFNEETGIVILASTTGDELGPGKGPIAEVVFEKVPGSEASVSSIMLVDRDRQLL